ncbi:hypothetical protein Tco_1057046 [Tanacetum coccineum]|uniref:Retrovirus-related Pol polyprotein from transposon TNT 1-94 n=1 Tax=Tanacetum coccineum TaxID=301880 RepID=A0ABQ5H4G7_9ASTR
MGNVKKSVAERTHHQRQYDRRMNKRQIQTQESKTDTGKALDAELVVTESSRTESEVQDDSSGSGNDTDVDDADIIPIYDEKPMAEIQEKVFAIAALKNELRKLKGNSVDTKFAKTTVSGKPNLQSLRNQPVVRQSNAFESERPQISKPQFASQADVKNDLSKLVTQHYLPGRRESALAKPDQVIASSSFRNSSKNMPRFRSNNMVHYHYLEAAKKKTQERDRNSKTSVMPSARFQSTVDGSKQQVRSNNQSTRSLPKSKSSYVTITVVPKQITLGILEVNSRAKIQSHKTRNSNKLVDQKSHTQKPGRQIITGHRFSPNKTFVVYEKKSPRSDLRWKPTGRIFKTVSLSWIPTRKILASCTSKADGSNVDISKIRECKQTLDLSACTCINVQKEQSFDLSAVLLLRTQLTDYGFHFDKIPMYCDSKAAIAISCNPVQHSRTKHIDVRYHFIKEQVEKGIVELFFVGTEYQLADLFTKALPEDRFKYLVRRLGMRCLTPEELEVLANESA